MNVDNYVVVTLSLNVNGDFKICNIDDDVFTSETSEKLKKVVLFLPV